MELIDELNVYKLFYASDEGPPKIFERFPN